MFGIGIGEIIIVLLIIFFLSPKEIPKFLRKAGQFIKAFNKIKDEVLQINDEVKDIINKESDDFLKEAGKEKKEVEENLAELNKNFNVEDVYHLKKKGIGKGKRKVRRNIKNKNTAK